MSKERNNVAILGTGHIAAKMAATLQQMKDVNCYAAPKLSPRNGDSNRLTARMKSWLLTLR